jgi:predicted nucleic acid-binding protein
MADVILDTNVFVAAGFRPRSAAALLVRAIREGRHRLVWSEPTRRETEAVLRRIPRLRWTGVEDLFRAGRKYEGALDPQAFSFVPDPDDRKFAALGAATGCPVISGDAHLLAHTHAIGAGVMTPRAFLEQEPWTDAAEASRRSADERRPS